jgi:hypothetical protein
MRQAKSDRDVRQGHVQNINVQWQKQLRMPGILPYCPSSAINKFIVINNKPEYI